MTRTSLAATLCASVLLTSSVNAADPAQCGSTYPAEFPCLRGGIVSQAPGLLFPGLKSMSLVVYDTTAADLVAKLTQAAQSEGWQVNSHIGNEPEGDRHRMRMSRATRVISASIYNDGERAVLQVMEFEPRT